MKSPAFIKGKEMISKVSRKSVPLYRWLSLIVALMFVSLYAAVSIGWLRPTSDISSLTRLEPILFLFVGYYFALSFSMADKRGLREEVERQKLRADDEAAARQAAEQATNFLTEKIKNADCVLRQMESDAPTGNKESVTNPLKVARRILSH